LADYGHAGDEAFGALRYGDGFSAHPLKVVYALAMLARSAGAQVHTGSSVIGMCRHGDQHILQTPQGQVRANHVVIATNGYSTEHVHSLSKSRLMSVLSCIVVTQPLSPEQQRQSGLTTLAIITDTRRLLYFYRLLPDGRLLLGSLGVITDSARSDAQTRNDL